MLTLLVDTLTWAYFLYATSELCVAANSGFVLVFF
jgi:hypothetical protein